MYRLVCFHLSFRLQVAQVLSDACDSERTPCQSVGESAVLRFEAAADLDFIPVLGVTHVLDRDAELPRQKNGTALNRSRRPSMLRAATCPWRSATTECSMRTSPPEWESGQRAMSPAAKIPGTLDLRYSSTTTPRSTFSLACSASSSAGRTPTPSTMKSASSVAAAGENGPCHFRREYAVLEMEDHAMSFVQTRTN